MKRVCSEAEKEILYKNKNQMLKGIYETASKSKWSDVFITLAISAVAMFAGIFWAGFNFNLSKGAMKAWMLFCFIITDVIVSAIMKAKRVKKEAKKFLKQKNLMVNGATIVAVTDIGGFAYIEDDFHDEEGKPIIIEYPSCSYEIKPEDVGKRILVMYDSDSNFQLVKLNDELKGLIPNYSSDFPLEKEFEEYVRVPHPNMLKVENTEHALSENEKEEFANLYVKIARGEAFKMAKVSVIVIIVGLLFICLLLDRADEGYPLFKTLPIAAMGFGGMVLFYWLMSCIGKVNLKRQAKFVHLKEVVFHSYVIRKNMAYVYVYEWVDGQIQMCKYSAGNISTATKYGNILYKFTHKKGNYVLQNMSLMNEKK